MRVWFEGVPDRHPAGHRRPAEGVERDAGHERGDRPCKEDERE